MATARYLLIEGVTGAGKSSVISHLRAAPALADHVLVDEDETLGSLMDDVRDPTWRQAPSLETLERTLERIERLGRPVLLERFHPSWFALLPDWSRFEGVDLRLAAMGFRLIMLSYPPSHLNERSLDRPERPGWGEGMAAWYGSQALAQRAVQESRRLRLDVLDLTRMPFLHLDTRERAWERYAATIVAWASGTDAP